MDDIIIKKESDFGFNVIYGNKSSGTLGYDECMGLVATLIVINSSKGCLNWLKTDEEHIRHTAYLLNFGKHIPQREPMLQLPVHIN